MADHFASLNRGEQGLATSDFTFAGSTTAGDKIELRVTDSSMTRKDVLVALEAFERLFEDSKATLESGFVFLAPN